MKKVIVYSLVGAMLLSSCSTTESGASNGAFFGSIIGSAIGGISGGHRGSDIGTLVGMAGGAVVVLLSVRPQRRRNNANMMNICVVVPTAVSTPIMVVTTV